MNVVCCSDCVDWHFKGLKDCSNVLSSENRRMTCDFTFFLIVFLSYQRVIMDTERLPAMDFGLQMKRFPSPAGIELGTAGSTGCLRKQKEPETALWPQILAQTCLSKPMILRSRLQNLQLLY